MRSAIGIGHNDVLRADNGNLCTIKDSSFASSRIYTVKGIFFPICSTLPGCSSHGESEEEVGSQHQGMDRPGVRQIPEGSGEQGKIEETGCEIICGAPTTLAAKGQVMMMARTIALYSYNHSFTRK